jgi:16S rRNA (uracil1498-N3)-methyltransferase
MEIFYGIILSNNELALDTEDSHHCIKVMRRKAGDEVYVTDGKGKLFRTIIEIANPKKCILGEAEIVKEEMKPHPKIHVAIAPTKSMDRFEWFLEKATEIGISEITPIICKRSERQTIKPERCEKIVLAAMKQSFRLWLPKLNPAVKFNEFLTSNTKPKTRNFICHCQSQNLPPLKSLYRKNEDVLILIGPEGDFTIEEIALAEQNGFQAVSLSKARLRTETAGMVTVQLVQIVNSE